MGLGRGGWEQYVGESMGRSKKRVGKLASEIKEMVAEDLNINNSR